jgi:hypothetical protein
MSPSIRRSLMGFVLIALIPAAIACSHCSSPGAVVAPSAAPDGGVDSGTPPSSAADSGADARTAPGVSVHAVIDLPRTLATQSLSATAFDPATRTLFALQDRRPSITPLVANDSFDAITVGAPFPLTGRGDAAWDGEGLVRHEGGTIAVTNETMPLVERFDAAGKRVEALAIPARFASQAPGNKGLESLTISPSGHYLFTANESALATDGPAATKTKGTTVRILRRELATGTDLEVAYRTEPLGAGGARGDMGVSELAALSDGELLVLERGFQSGYGNTVRIFRVDVTSGAHVDAIASLSDATPVLNKTLVVDISTLPPGNAKTPDTQPNPLLDNYEALALGPTLPDGRRLVFVTSDDNASASQVARVLVLAVPGL